MITPDLMIQPFAAQAAAGDVTVVPQTSPTGFVNFSDGYTSFYEINLASNNPLAKAVERGIMNYLFNALTKNAQAWQYQGYPAWYPNKPNGYDQNAVVVRLVGGVATPYRSLIDGNISDPQSSPTQWEYQPTAAEMKSNVPMPHGGPNGPSAAVIRAAVDFNSFTFGTFEVQSDATAATCTNIPNMPGATAKAGLLESIIWTDAPSAGNTIKVQRYTDTTGNVFIRSATNATHGPWVIQISMAVLQAGTGLFTNATPDSGTNTYRAILSPIPGALTDGMEVKVAFTRDSLAGQPATFILNGMTAYQITGTALTAINATSIKAGSLATLRLNLASNSWAIMSMTGSPRQGIQAVAADEVPTFGQIVALLNNKANKGVNSDITSITGLTIPLSVSQGGSGVNISTGTTANVLSDSPTLTGVPLAPTAAPGTNTQQIASTAFVQAAVSIVSVAVGTVDVFATMQPPAGYLAANGSAVSRTVYAALFAAITVTTTGAKTSGNNVITGITSPAPSAMWVGMPVSGPGIQAGTTITATTSSTITLSLNATASSTGPLVVAPFGNGDGSTTFGLPDMRGRVARGWDNGAGNDPSRVFGSLQADAFNSHNHGVNDPGHAHGVNDPSHFHTVFAGSSTVSLATGGIQYGVFSGQQNTQYSGTGVSIQTAFTNISTQMSGLNETRMKNIALLPCIKF